MGKQSNYHNSFETVTYICSCLAESDDVTRVTLMLPPAAEVTETQPGLKSRSFSYCFHKTAIR